MNEWLEDNRWFLYLLFLVSLISIVIGLAAKPTLIESLFSKDGTLAEVTQVKINLMRYLMIFIGMVLLGYSVSGYYRSKYLERLNDSIYHHVLPLMFQRKAIAWLILVLLALVCLNRITIIAVKGNWRKAVGHEYYWIAESISAGHGYSLAADHRWYFYDFQSTYPTDEYYPTALEEPVYPYLLAFSYKAFGEYHRLFIIILQIVILFVTAFLIYLLCLRLFHSHMGVIGAMVLILWWRPVRHLSELLAPQVIAGFMLCLVAYLVLWVLDKVSIKRGMVLGFILGVNCLTLAAGLLMTPIAIVAILVLAKPKNLGVWKTAIAAGVVAVLIVIPWTIRNYAVFGELVPVRTGFGLALHQSNPTIAATYTNGNYACADAFGPIWKAKNVREALRLTRTDQQKRMAIYKRSYDCIAYQAPEDYGVYNEVQRDKVYLQKSLFFIKSEPRLFVALALERLRSFFLGWERRHSLSFILAVIGALAAIRNPKAMVVIFMILGYTFTFSLAGSWSYRYRYPIEPFFFLLACFIPAKLIDFGSIFIHRRFK